MSSEKEKRQNILTAIIVAIALAMAVAVVLVKTGVLNRDETTTEMETIVESSVIVESSTNEEGEVEYYSFLEYYTRPKVKSNHTYPTTTTKPTTTTTTTTEPESTTAIVEHSTVVAVTNEDGELQTDDNGEPVTEVRTYTEVITDPPSTEETESTETTETTTEYVEETEYSVVTDKVFHKAVKDKNGNKVTTVIVLNPTTAAPTTEDRWSENTESTATTAKAKIQVTANVTRDDQLANAIVSQINDDRAAEGLDPLTTDNDLRAAARTNSLAMAVPDLYNKETGYSKLYNYTTSYGGKSLYNVISTSGGGNTSKSTDITKVGVGVIKSGDKYYTTVIFE